MYTTAHNVSPALRHRVAGVTLIELMVALAIGSFLLIGAVTVFTQSRTTFRVTESVSRLQENARFVMDTVVLDVRMAGYFGLTSRASRIGGRATASDPNGLGPDDCGTNWTIDLAAAVDGTNNSYTWTCDAYDDDPSATSDTLVIRRVSEDEVTGALDADTLYVQSGRAVTGQIFLGTAVPTLPGISQTNRLVVNGYYVSDSSTLSTPGNLVPSLRAHTLRPGSAGAAVINDLEVLPGVEDMQVQFGVDVDPIGEAGRGSVDRYVNPGTALPAGSQILAVRLWFRLRSERPETGHVDTTRYQYADQDYTPAGAERGYRRIVVSKTIFLRNTRTVT